MLLEPQWATPMRDHAPLRIREITVPPDIGSAAPARYSRASSPGRPICEAADMNEPVPFEFFAGIYLHGTKAQLPPGELLLPA